MVRQVYSVPITGKALSWGSFSGDPDNAIRPVLPSIEEAVFRVLEYRPDQGSCTVEMEADEDAHTAFSEWLGDRSLARICRDEGVTQLKRPPDAERPRVSLKMYHRRQGGDKA